MIIYPNAALNFLFLIFLLFPFTNSLTHNKKEHTLRFTEEKFLMDDIAKAEHNTLINNYLSTKYLYWNKGIRGQGIKIGIFDSGVNNSYIKCNIKKSYDFTNDNNEEDYQGHGTYIASLICSESIGISPMSEIYSYKIFSREGKTNEQWIKAAIAKAIADKVNIMNMSFGGINFNDQSTIALIKEAITKGIIITVSAGNEGPSNGSVVFPGNLAEVITVGSASKNVFDVYKYSSRGPAIYNRNTLIPKPNTWCIGEDVVGFTTEGRKVIKNGSSISTGIVSAFIALGMSLGIKEEWNIAKVMRMIYDSNIEMVGLNGWEKGSGLFNPEGMLGIIEMKESSEMIRIYNWEQGDEDSFIFDDETDEEESDDDKKKDNTFEMYTTRISRTYNLIVLNEYHSFNDFTLPLMIGLHNESNSTFINGKCFNVSLLNPSPLISHIFLLQLLLSPTASPKCEYYKEHIDWMIKFTDQSGKFTFKYQMVFDFIPKPSKLSRIIIDHSHNLIFPFDGFVPKDDLLSHIYDYDWTYESIDTNYFTLYNTLKEEGYYIEEVTNDISTISFDEYSLLIIIDTEKEFTKEEIELLQHYYEKKHLSLLIITEWSNPSISSKFDTSSSFTSGSDIKSLNTFLLKYNIAISQNSLSGTLYFQNKKIQLNSCNSISLFPQSGFLFGGLLSNDAQFIDASSSKSIYASILGLYESKNDESGRIGIFTDSYCIDDYQLGHSMNDNNCFWLMSLITRFLIHGNFAYNDLALNSKTPLTKIYYNGDSISYDSSTSIKTINDISKGDIVITDEIPNELATTSNRGVVFVDNGSIVEILKGVLAVFIPIFGILIIMFIVIQCKARDYKKRRIFAIRSLIEMRPLSVHASERKRLNSVSSINSSTELKIDI